MTVQVDFEPVGRRGHFPAGTSLLDCARQLGVELVNLCGGTGSCGRCVVQVLDGTVSEPEAGEDEYLSPAELAQGYRLACRARLVGACKVRIPPESLTAPQRTQVEGEEIPAAPAPPVHTYTVTLLAPTLEDLRADAERLRAVLAEQHGIVVSQMDLAALQTLSPRLRDGRWQLSTAVRQVPGVAHIADATPTAGRAPTAGSAAAWERPLPLPRAEIVAVGPPAARCLGLAVDLGTTKIAAYLVDLETGRTLASQGLMNPQIAYGEDVIARLTLSMRSMADAKRLQTLVVDALNETVAGMCAEVGAATEEIVEAVVVGNTAMHHLFLGLPVEQLARAPYVPAVSSALDVKARDLGLRIAPGAYVHLLPNIAGYVGADHVAMLLATGMDRVDNVVLALDIGTNTEVCLAHQGRLTSLSCASGPAFEGAHIKHGMRAANGAIEHLRLVDDRVEYQTIGAAPPVGLCGSGILDILAQLYQAGVVDARGRMGEHPRVHEAGGMREFVVTGTPAGLDAPGPGGDRFRPAITFTQKDVRELQLAKGAMRTGIQALLAENGLSEAEIEQVIIAGAFGTYIDVTSAMTIGMLPRLPLDRFRQVGNAAGMGAKLALISDRKRLEAQDLAKRVNYIELACVPNFSQIFARAMYLGQNLF
jgi:uncharacterized 2Fe-2S/4Fe-4S cluster protein (DUF4445 family)